MKYLIKMKLPLCLISFISINILPKINSQGSSKVPGYSSCGYYGSTLQSTCNTPFVNISDLPKECTSFFWYKIKVDASSNVNFGFDDPGNPGYVKSMISSGKPTFIIYNHDDIQEWVDILSQNKNDGGVTAQTEMKNLKQFVSSYQNLGGFILGLLDVTPDTTNTDCFSDNLKLYINEMRKTFPDYGIGIFLEAYTVLQATYFYSNTTYNSLDINVVDSCLDFYVIDAYMLNDCTDEFKVGGVSPVSTPGNQTLTDLFKSVEKMKIPKEKLYIVFNTGPFATDPSIDTCDLTEEVICSKPSLDGYCVDNIKSYYDKGVFTKKNAAGFLANDIDLFDDPLGSCKCGTKFPGFYAMLAGFEGSSSPASCPLLDKQ